MPQSSWHDDWGRDKRMSPQSIYYYNPKNF
jgi:hypothetical protein